MRALLPFLVLGAAQFLVRPETSAEGGAALAARFPGAVERVLFSGFRPLVVQYLYASADRARREGRILDLRADVEVLARAEPDNARAIAYLASVLAFDLPPLESRVGDRLELIRSGLRVLEEAAVRMPSDPRFPLMRGLVLAHQVGGDPELARAWRRSTGRHPLADARSAFHDALALAPGSPSVRASWLKTGLDLALEQLGAGLLDEAEGSLAEGLARARTWEGEPLGPNRELSAAWLGMVRALRGGAPPALSESLAGLAAAIRRVPPPAEGGGGRDELAAWLFVLPRVLRTVEGEAASDPRSALSLLRALHNIQALLSRRLAALPGGADVRAPTDDYEERWRALVELLQGRLPEAARSALQEVVRPW